MDMSRIRIEGLLAAFPKLVGTGKQHTYVETENVRYVYQPIESLYLLLVTNKQSNILEDLETLRLLSKLVSLILVYVFFSWFYILLNSCLTVQLMLLSRVDFLIYVIFLYLFCASTTDVLLLSFVSVYYKYEILSMIFMSMM